MTGPADELLAGLVDDLVRRVDAADGPLVVGLAGPVAAGKTTLAAALASGIGRSGPPGRTVEVVGTDAFLHPNAVLEARGLLFRKGFPESYDVDELRAVVAAARRGEPTLRLPVYSHERYDRVEPGRVAPVPDLLLLEGVNALQPGPVDLLDVAVYLDVDEALALEWYTRRFVDLAREARADDASFYRTWADLPEPEVRAVAAQVWEAVNGVNLREHILPSRSSAHVVVRKGPDHRVVAVEWA